jgi:hypothetical protein
MSVRSISLQKLIKILFSPANRRVSGIRKDIREDMKRSQNAAACGGDFLRVLLFRNVSGLHVTASGGWRMLKAAYTGDFGLLTECVAAITFDEKIDFVISSTRC